MTAPLVSVVIPTHGRPRWLVEAVESVLAQGTDAEVVVVDDASPEPVRLPRDPRVRLVRREVNGGSAAARNAGLDASTGPFVAFLDDDDLYLPGRLERGVAALDDACFSVCLARRSSQARPVEKRLDGDVSGTILGRYTPQLGTVTLRRADAPRFDERIRGVEDVEWWLRLAQLGPGAAVEMVGVLIRDHQELRAHSTLIERIAGREVMLEEHEAYFAQHPRSHAFQLLRMSTTARQAGDLPRARALARSSLRVRPSLRAARALVADVLRPARG